MKKALVILTLLAATLLAGAVIGHRLTAGDWPTIAQARQTVFKSGSQGQPTEAPEPDASDDEPPSTVQAKGRISPEDGVCSVGAAPGYRVEEVLVHVGDAVKKDQPLLRLEGRSERTLQRDSLAAQLEEGSELVAVETELERLALADAKAEKDTLEVQIASERQVQDETIRLLDQKAKSSAAEYARLSQLNQDKRQIVSTQELELKYFTMRRDEVDLKNARTNLEALKQTQAIKLRQAALGPPRIAAGSAKAQLAAHRKSLEKELALAELRLKQTEVAAPVDARVLRLAARPGQLTGAGPLVELGKTEAMHVIAEVYEDQVRYVRTGQTVTFRSPALSRSYRGTVKSLALMVAKNDVLGLDPAAAAYSRVVEVDIAVADADAELRDRTHLQVDVTIDVSGRPSGLAAAKAEPGPAGGPTPRPGR